MADNKSSLLFIPDITGFTEFVNDTEIQHGQHIISELLEIIVKSNKLSLEVSEIEGDAVLFYKEGEIPRFEQLLDQAKAFFLNFHNHLKRYERDRICECGACTNTSTLSLKIIAHVGEIGFTHVLKKRKPYGADIILIHRLLKNDVNLKEYFLLSYKLVDYYGSVNVIEDWQQILAGSSLYDKIGEVKYRYIPFEPLYQWVQTPPPLPSPKMVKDPIIYEIFIERPMYFVFEMVFNLDLRLQWNKEARELEYEKNRVNRAGTRHRCLFNTGFADFETIKGDFGKDNLVYGERFENIPIAREISSFYILSEKEKGTHLRLEIHISPIPLVGKMLIFLMSRKINKMFTRQLKELKRTCEQADALEFKAATV